MTHYEHTKIAMADIPGLMHLARVHLDALAGLKGVLVVLNFDGQHACQDIEKLR